MPVSHTAAQTPVQNNEAWTLSNRPAQTADYPPTLAAGLKALANHLFSGLLSPSEEQAYKTLDAIEVTFGKKQAIQMLALLECALKKPELYQHQQVQTADQGPSQQESTCPHKDHASDQPRPKNI
ncbi:MAG: hypothetical protein HC848_10050, partial [Limnobacter sp.]|nr:hypothetical protein [Limnobacter sp.]